MLEPDAGPTRKSGSQRGAGRQRPAPTRQRRLRCPTPTMLLRLADAVDIVPAQLVTDTVERLTNENHR
jgi:hypothetical protein